MAERTPRELGDLFENTLTENLDRFLGTSEVDEELILALGSRAGDLADHPLLTPLVVREGSPVRRATETAGKYIEKTPRNVEEGDAEFARRMRMALFVGELKANLLDLVSRLDAAIRVMTMREKFKGASIDACEANLEAGILREVRVNPTAYDLSCLRSKIGVALEGLNGHLRSLAPDLDAIGDESRGVREEMRRLLWALELGEKEGSK